MARSRRDPRASVVEELRGEPWLFEFFQVVRILEATRAGAAPVGTGSDPSAEAVRFRSDPSLAFPASEVLAVDVPDDPRARSQVVVSFLGLAGEQGPLPRPFTELVLERIAARDTAARDFLDIFNHRLVSLLYRAREKYRVGLRIQPPERSQVGDVAFSLVGLGGAGLRERMRAPDRSLLLYAGTLAHGRRTAAGLEGLLTDYFHGIMAGDGRGSAGHVRVREFVGRWHAFDPDQATVLGLRGGRCELGVDAVLGSRVWDQCGMIEVVVGPLDFTGFRRFLPGGDALDPLVDLTTFYLRGDADFAVRLVLRAPEVPATALSSGGGAARLGLTSWLKTAPFTRDAEDVVLSPARACRPAAPPGTKPRPGTPATGVDL